MCSGGAHRRGLVDNRAWYLHKTFLCRLARPCRVSGNRVYLRVCIFEKFGGEAARASKRSTARACCDHMNATLEKRDHERKDVDVPSLLTIVVLLFFSCAIIFLIVWGMMHYFKLHEPARTAGQANLPVTSSEEFPKPRLQVKGAVDLANLRAAEEADLESYGWIDRNSGTVRIPI